MAFTKDVKFLTNSGWKLASDIKGNDKLLIRNFLGDAEFIQPFAIKKRSYDGEVVRFGGAYWCVSVTPEHKIGFRDGIFLSATSLEVDRHKFLRRQFRYIREDRRSEFIQLEDRSVSISDEDWYTILAYTVTMGFISKDKNPRVKFMCDIDNIIPMLAILDFYGLDYNVEDNLVITVNRNNNLARKLKLHLGARARRDFRLPDKMIYGSPRALSKHFIGTFTSLCAKPSKTRPNQLTFSTSNENLMDSIKMMCLFAGYAFSATLSGEIWLCYVIPAQVSDWTIRKVDKINYSGYTYEVDIFNGEVYATEGNLPVWVNPK